MEPERKEDTISLKINGGEYRNRYHFSKPLKALTLSSVRLACVSHFVSHLCIFRVGVVKMWPI
jgi:hypothetical protein